MGLSPSNLFKNIYKFLNNKETYETVYEDNIPVGQRKIEVEDKYFSPAYNTLFEFLKASEVIINKLVIMEAIALSPDVDFYNNYVNINNISPYNLTKEEFEMIKKAYELLKEELK